MYFDSHNSKRYAECFIQFVVLLYELMWCPKWWSGQYISFRLQHMDAHTTALTQQVTMQHNAIMYNFCKPKWQCNNHNPQYIEQSQSCTVYGTAQFKLYTCASTHVQVHMHMLACLPHVKLKNLAFTHTIACNHGIHPPDNEHVQHMSNTHH